MEEILPGVWDQFEENAWGVLQKARCRVTELQTQLSSSEFETTSHLQQQTARVEELLGEKKTVDAKEKMCLEKEMAAWISLIQYDDERYETAESWFTKRVLNEQQLSHWAPAARYNLARTVERLGNVDRAIELYKTDGDPQEHGNRIRARLLAKSAEK